MLQHPSNIRQLSLAPWFRCGDRPSLALFWLSSTTDFAVVRREGPQIRGVDSDVSVCSIVVGTGGAVVSKSKRITWVAGGALVIALTSACGGGGHEFAVGDCINSKVNQDGAA